MKEIYFANLERLLANGCSYDLAGDIAYTMLQTDMASRIDYLRQRQKEEGPKPLPVSKDHE